MTEPPKATETLATTQALATTTQALARRHLRLGWWMFFVYLTVGAALEGLHGFKVSWYLGGAGETRRLLWTLAHAHGTLFGLAHVAFAATVKLFPDASWSALESWCLTCGSVLVPAGFFLGGVVVYDGDPGLGVLLVPPGVLLLIVGVASIASRTRRA